MRPPHGGALTTSYSGTVGPDTHRFSTFPQLSTIAKIDGLARDDSFLLVQGREESRVFSRLSRPSLGRPEKRSSGALPHVRWELASLEGRGLLLGEGGNAIPEVLTPPALGDGLGLQLHLGLQALVGGLVEEELGSAEGQGRPLG